MVAFSEALRREVYADNIRVSCIEPGVVETELRDAHRACGDEVDAGPWAASMRQLQPEDVADAIVFCVTRPSHVNVNEI